MLLSEVDSGARRRLMESHQVVDAHSAPARVPDLLKDAEVAVFRSGVRISEEDLAAATALRLVLRAGSGLDNIDLDAAQRFGVRVVRIPGPSSRAVAELTLGLMIALSRRIVEADASMRRGEWNKSELSGHLLRGKVAGVVGLGNIGSVVAGLCAAVGMRVLGCLDDPSEMTVRRWMGAGVEVMELERLAAQADVLTLHVPLDGSTRHLVDRRLLSLMQPGAYLINTSRGGVVDEAALADALEGGLGGAALDVHEREGGGRSPLADLANVVLTPHIGSMAAEAQFEIGRRLVELIDGFADGRMEELLTEHERVA